MISGASLLHVREEAATTVDGGTITGTSDNIRVLDTVVTNGIIGASLGSNQITLPAGTYYVDAHAPTWSDVNFVRVHLYNVTDAAVEILGIAGVGNSNMPIMSTLRGIFTITSEKVFELRHYVLTTVSTTGAGIAADDGTIEIYADVVIEQLAVG